MCSAQSFSFAGAHCTKPASWRCEWENAVQRRRAWVVKFFLLHGIFSAFFFAFYFVHLLSAILRLLSRQYPFQDGAVWPDSDVVEILRPPSHHPSAGVPGRPRGNDLHFFFWAPPCMILIRFPLTDLRCSTNPAESNWHHEGDEDDWLHHRRACRAHWKPEWDSRRFVVVSGVICRGSRLNFCHYFVPDLINRIRLKPWNFKVVHHRSIRLIDWLVKESIDWSTDWFDWLIDCILTLTESDVSFEWDV